MVFTPKIVTCLIVVLTVYMAVQAESDIKCGTVTGILAQCVNYLTNSGPLPSGCCEGVKSLNSMAQTSPDRRQVCECLKMAAKDIKGLDIGLVAALPTTCGISLPFPISLSINCDKYISYIDGVTCKRGK